MLKNVNMNNLAEMNLWLCAAHREVDGGPWLGFPASSSPGCPTLVLQGRSPACPGDYLVHMCSVNEQAGGTWSRKSPVVEQEIWQRPPRNKSGHPWCRGSSLCHLHNLAAFQQHSFASWRMSSTAAQHPSDLSILQKPEILSSMSVGFMGPKTWSVVNTRPREAL